eukprot:6194991-Pleurochrysis_carterae.AAC.2
MELTERMTRAAWSRAEGLEKVEQAKENRCCKLKLRGGAAGGEDVAWGLSPEPRTKSKGHTRERVTTRAP